MRVKARTEPARPGTPTTPARPATSTQPAPNVPADKPLGAAAWLPAGILDETSEWLPIEILDEPSDEADDVSGLTAPAGPLPGKPAAPASPIAPSQPAAPAKTTPATPAASGRGTAPARPAAPASTPASGTVTAGPKPAESPGQAAPRTAKKKAAKADGREQQIERFTGAMFGVLGVLAFRAWRAYGPSARSSRLDDDADDEEASPGGTRETRRGERAGVGRVPSLPIGVWIGGALVLASAVVLVIALAGGRRRPVAGPPRTGQEVVFGTPLPPGEVAAARQGGPPPAAPAVPPDRPAAVSVAVAVLPPVGADTVTEDDAPADWSGAPDPPPEAAAEAPAGKAVVLPVANQFRLAGMGGPFVLETIESQRNMAMRRQPNPTLGDEANLQARPLPVWDLRTGRKHARFAWWALPYATTRLSPDGRYLISADHDDPPLATARDGELFVWEAEQPAPVRRLKLPGGVTWMEFVANDRLAVLTYRPAPVLQVWDVTKAELSGEIELPADEFPPPRRSPGDEELARRGIDVKPFAPNPLAGAVSPTGRLVALGGLGGVTVVSFERGQAVGTLPLPRRIRGPAPADGGEPPAGPREYRGISFSPNGRELHALVLADSMALASWSLETGRPVRALGLGPKVEARTNPEIKYAFRGAPMPGPTPSTLILPLRDGNYQPRLRFGGNPPPLVALDYWVVSPGAVVDAARGAIVADLDILPLRPAGPGRVLALGDLAKLPDVPLPALDERGTPFPDKVAAGAEASLRARFKALYFATLVEEGDRSHLIAPEGGGARPAAQPGDRGELAATTPEPPPAWSPPPAPPGPVEGLKAVHGAPSTRPLFGDDRVGFVASKAPGNMERPAGGMSWFRVDLRTGEPIGEPIPLWPWIASSDAALEVDLRQTPLAAGMSRDGRLVALRDPADPGRVDVWDEQGTRILGLIPYEQAAPVQWVGWSAQGHLLTIGEGKLTGWDVPSGKAVYEVEGGYRLPAASPRGGGWVAVSAGPHIDLLDADSGRCLGRLAPSVPGGPPSGFDDLAVSLDGSMLACLPTPPEAADGEATALGRLVTGWDLTTGKPLATVAVPPQPPSTPAVIFQQQGAPTFARAMVALNARRVMVGNDLIDLGAGAHLATYTYPSGAGLGEGQLPSSPDGRPWAIFLGGLPARAAEATVRRVDLPGSGTGLEDFQNVFTKKTPLSVEADLGGSEISRKFGRAELARLQAEGFTIGRGGWRLVVTHEVKDTPQRLTNGMVVPYVTSARVIYAPDGSKAWEQELTFHFTTQSRYFTGTRDTGKAIGLSREVEHQFNFGGQRPREAIAGELLEQAAQPFSIPPKLGRFAGKYQAIPAGLLVPLNEPGADPASP